MIAVARENGIDLYDTADVYGGASGFGGAETLLGEVRKRAPKLLDGAVIATKAGCEPGSPYNSSPAYLKAACEASLKRLGVPRIDLFYVHRPICSSIRPRWRACSTISSPRGRSQCRRVELHGRRG